MGTLTPSVYSLTLIASSLEEGALGMVGKFLIASETLATGLAACALSVTCGDTSPKGRGKSTAESFLIVPNTLASRLPAWLSLRERLRGQACKNTIRKNRAAARCFVQQPCFPTYILSSTFFPVSGSGMPRSASIIAMRIYTPLCT